MKEWLNRKYQGVPYYAFIIVFIGIILIGIIGGIEYKLDH